MNPELGYQNYVTYGYKRSIRKKRNGWILNFVVLFLLAWIVLVPVYIVRKVASAQEKTKVLLSPLAANPYPEQEVLGASLSTTNATSPTELRGIVMHALDQSKGTYSVAIKNLRTGEEYYYNDHESYMSASLYKLWVMAVVYTQIHQGKLKETEVLSEDIDTLNTVFKIPEDSAELQDGQITLSVTRALEQMITISHNYAALLLVEKVKISNITLFLKSNSLLESRAGSPPKTSAHDITVYYEKLYKGEIINKGYSDKMIDLLARQQLNDRIPKYLPQGTKVAHKTGELDGVKHDGGIVYTDKGDYIFVVMSDTPSPADAAENTALLSKAVYDYFQSK